MVGLRFSKKNDLLLMERILEETSYGRGFSTRGKDVVSRRLLSNREWSTKQRIDYRPNLNQNAHDVQFKINVISIFLFLPGSLR